VAIQIGALLRVAEANQQALHDGGVLRYYTGSLPATIETAATGTLVAEFDLPTPAYTIPSVDDGSQAVATAKPIATTNAVADGSPVTYYRSYASGGVDPDDALKQGTISATGGGGDMIIDDPNITNGEPLSVGTWTYTQPRQTIP